MLQIILFLAVHGSIQATQDYYHEKDIVKTKSLKGIQPSHYKIDLIMPNYANGPENPFTGIVEIEFKPIKSGIDQVYLHVKGPNISAVNVASNKKGADIEAKVGETISEDDLIAINLSKKLKKSQTYHLRAMFEAKLHHEHGLFYTQNSNNEKVWALTTLFEMRQARMAIPCMDHPVLKATFELCVAQPVKSAIVLNNMRSKSTTATKDGEKICFHKTPKMPTYALTLAILAGYLKQSMNLTDKITSDVYFPKTINPQNLKWVEKAAGKAVKYLVKTTRAKFPLNHLDFLFDPGLPWYIWGIENFGLISLAAHKFADGQNRHGQRMLAHEVLHQYIGNDFTVSSWDDLCIQEGFTTYMDFKTSNVTMGADYKVAIHNARVAGLTRQKYKALKPLITPFKDIYQVVRSCYNKGPAIISMYDTGGVTGTKMNKYVGKLSKKYRFGNLGAKEYFTMFKEVFGANLANSLESFFRYPGFPVVLVKKQKNHVKLSTKYVEPGLIVSNKTMTYSLPIQLVGAKGPKMVTKFPIKIKCPSKSCYLDPRLYYYQVYYETKFYQKAVDCFVKPTKQCPDQNILRSVIADFLQSGIGMGIVPVESKPKLSEMKSLTVQIEKLYLEQPGILPNPGAFTARCFHAMKEVVNDDERENKEKCKNNRWFKLANVY